MRLITVHLPDHLVQGLEKLVEGGRYPSRSEAIRVAVRDLLNRELYSRTERRGLMMG
ncbi:MAG: CopG family transcriptional regulator [Thermoprotei archaeon]|nr:MAG: CopG family transcriptional regulator [Thermoprotei archaeon]